MKLHYAQFSRAVRVAWLLEELELLYEIEKYTIGERALRESDFKKISPLGRVPVLIDGDVTLHESGAIIQYLLAKYSSGFLEKEPTDSNFHQYLQWFHFAEGMIMPPLNTIVVETVLLSPDRKNETNVRRATKILGQILQTVENRLCEVEYLAGEFTAADIMSGHALIMSAHHGVDLNEKPKCKRYIDKLMSRPQLQKAWSL
ncbi:MAG: glutathione S-transferase family protein [Paracoccaceae bacterium]|nr:glutathione S-transferase family protein [Paracoccaceae bacterium]